jgi:hypothetical protein
MDFTILATKLALFMFGWTVSLLLLMQEGVCRGVKNRQISHAMSAYSKFIFIEKKSGSCTG